MSAAEDESPHGPEDRSSGLAVRSQDRTKASVRGGLADKSELKPSMSLKQALGVKWLRSRPRSIGELLDEGYLDAARLEWAARYAYNPALREASEIVLDWQRQHPREQRATKPAAALPPEAGEKAFPLSMSLQQARSTPWPLRPFSGQPMGMLSETRKLSLKDLAFAIENAWDDRVRQAATTLLLVRLDQQLKEPQTPAGPLQVVAPARTFGQRRQFKLTLLEGLIMGAGLASSVWLLIVQLLRQSPSQPRMTLPTLLASPSGIVAFVTVLTASVATIWLALFLFNRGIDRLDQAIENYRRGQEAEDRVVERARQALDGDWVLFRNVVLPGRNKGDIDIVLVGPPGVWALEVKGLHGEYRNIGESWEKRAGNRWKRAKSNPSRQANDNAIRLKGFLGADGVKTFIPAAVVWANEDNPPVVDNPTVAVWTMDRLGDELGNLWNGKRLEEETRMRIVDKLTRLIQSSGQLAHSGQA